MLTLYQDPDFTFRFSEDRLIPRFHLEGVIVGCEVTLFQIDPKTGDRLGVLASGLSVGKDGWVELSQPILMRAGEAFIAVPDFNQTTNVNE